MFLVCQCSLWLPKEPSSLHLFSVKSGYKSENMCQNSSRNLELLGMPKRALDISIWNYWSMYTCCTPPHLNKRYGTCSTLKTHGLFYLYYAMRPKTKVPQLSSFGNQMKFSDGGCRIRSVRVRETKETVPSAGAHDSPTVNLYKTPTP